MRILYFLEDRLQEGFIKALVERIARDSGVNTHHLVHDVRSARGGSKVIGEFKQFIRDTQNAKQQEGDVLIIAIDGNCKGFNEMKKRLAKCIKPNHLLSQKIVYAIPDPHIEHWYLMDQRALKEGIGLDKAPDLPAYKCKRDYYKKLLNSKLKESNVSSLLGGAEYAEKIVDQMGNLAVLGEHDVGFKTFVEDLKHIFKQAQSTS